MQGGAPRRAVDRRVATRRRRDARRHRLRVAAELVLVGAALGWAQRLSSDADQPAGEDVALVRRLAEANELLASLHQLTSTLPSSLDMEQSLDSTVATLRSFWDLDALAVLVPADTSDGWVVVRQEGTRLADSLEPEQLPPAVGRAARSPVGRSTLEAGGDRGVGLTPARASGLYTPLHARGQLVGLLAVEHADPGYFGVRDVGILDGLTEVVALSLDNAKWFARLRTVGADAERARIAGELHDRVGQSLASLGFTLDRLARHSADEELRPGIDGLRTDLRSAMAEIRGTLSDLRADASEQR